MIPPKDLVYIDDYSILGSSFYWNRFADYGLTKEDILNVGLTDDRIQVSKKIIKSLVAVDEELKVKGWRLYIKEGYRSEALYKILYQRRTEKFGKETTDSLLNIDTMPHTTGLSVDVAIWDNTKNQEIFLRNKEDGIQAFFVDFYRHRVGDETKRYQELQDYLVDLMRRHGFKIGVKREYWHFDYLP
jgi:D-alanyl-D-alanine dipeptidase